MRHSWRGAHLRFASSITRCTDLGQAIEELVQPALASMASEDADLALLFATAHYEDELDSLLESVTTAFPAATVMGCTAEGTIGPFQEVEQAPSISLLVGALPNVGIYPFHVRQEHIEQSEGLHEWERIVGAAPESNPTFMAIGDPFRVNIHAFIERINEIFPGARIIGGIASAGYEPGQNRLIIDGQVVREGLVGIALTGQVKIDTVVSQGCRPIGRPFVITKGDRNVIRELGGRSGLMQLHDVLVGLPVEDEALARQALFVGRVIDEHKREFRRGDFLIRNIIGFDRSSGAIGIADHARVGATIQFQVRDAASADADLRTLLAPYAGGRVQGAVLFDCNGRGTQMWPMAGHDVGVVAEILGTVPVAGCFCGGEFGPVGGNNFIHGFTASIGLFSEPD